MSFRTLLLATACSAFLAASAAVSGAAPATPEARLAAEAYKALQAGDAEAAVAGYTKAIESRALSPEVLANALLNRGLAYQRINQHEYAIDDYTAALRIDALSGKVRALALYNRGLSYQRLERNSQAMEDFTSALFLDGQFSHAYYSRGTLLRDGGQYLFALADFDKALRYNYPDAARVYVAEAATFDKLKRTADARDALTKALAANPNYEPARQRLAVLDGAPAAKPATAAAADQIQTADISPASDNLPPAKAPPGALTGGETLAAEAPYRKKYTDRVPQEQPVRVAAAATTQNDATQAEEKVLAVETVPDDSAASGAPASKPVIEAASAPVDDASDAPATTTTTKVTGWAVQIVSASTEDAAWSAWKKMKERYKVLSSKGPVVVRADLGSKGVVYRVRLVGFDSQDGATGECKKLKSKGVKCFISKAAS